jgi:hypothetical protein
MVPHVFYSRKPARAFSGEVDTGSPQENATNASNLEHDPIPKERIVL